MSEYTPDDVEQDFIDAIFKVGEIAGILSKHRKTHPHRVHMVRQMALSTIPPDVVEQFHKNHLAPTVDSKPMLPPIDGERHAELIVENADLKRALGFLLHSPNSPQATQVARTALGQPSAPVLEYDPPKQVLPILNDNEIQLLEALRYLREFPHAKQASQIADTLLTAAYGDYTPPAPAEGADQ